MPKTKLPEEMDYIDCSTEADEIRIIRTAIEQNLNIIGVGPVTKKRDAALYTIKILCASLDAVADIIEEIGNRDGNE